MILAWQLLAGVLLVGILALYEVYVDKTLKRVYQKFISQWRFQDNMMDKYKMYNKAAHQLQTPYRGMVLLLLSVLIVGYDATGWQVVMQIIMYFFYIGGLYWIVFDILANRLWLDQKWYYIGGTAGTDNITKSYIAHFAMKLAVFLLGLIPFIISNT